jgi:hypothetical protein
MNWKGCEKKRSWPNLRFYPIIYLEELRKPGKPQSGYLVFRPRFELGTSRTRAGSRRSERSEDENGDGGYVEVLKIKGGEGENDI